jgi:hypothetical protein
MIFLHGWVSRAYFMQEPQRGQRSGDAASAQCTYDAPRDQALTGQAHGTAHLGERGKQQIGADRQVGFHAKEKDQDRRHQGAAADAGQADDDAHKEAGKDESKIMHGRECSGSICTIKRFISC